MQKILLIILTLINFPIFGQIFINEVDADTVGTDNKEFIELKSNTPNFSLDGYVLVFFNGTSSGTGNASYFTLDLDGLTTDVNGNVLIGNALVSPTPAVIVANNIIQNGPDGIGLYLGNDTDFPLGTIANNTNLIDSIAYNFSPTQLPTALMTSFGISVFVNEAANINATIESMQRKPDGTFEVKTPTPGVNNDGSGIPLIYVATNTNLLSVNEGQNLIITCTTSQPVANNDLVLSFTLNNGNFNSSDFSGTNSIIIPVGSSSSSSTIAILNDGNNEGDEEAKIVLTSSSATYNLNNNNLIIRINDLNFSVLSFGTPANPTFGQVSNLKPTGYYDSLNGLSGIALKQAIQNIIANPAVVQAQNYGDVYDILKDADQNPANSNQVWLIYNEQPRSKIDIQTGNSIVGKWNREHIYCQSRGGFSDGTSSFADGINTWLPTGPNDILAGHADAHHIRSVDGQENSSRNNRNYGVDYNGPSGSTSNAWKGDVARALFYMAVRYNGLNVVNGNPPETPDGYIGDLATLLTWNNLDPADDFEMNRNNIIFNWQKNRNPFIDMPNLASYVFGNNIGQLWSNTLSIKNINNDLQVKMYPNPANDFINIEGLNNKANIEIFNAIGEKILEETRFNNEKLNFNLASGIYLVKIVSENKSVIKKLVVQ
jgi:endonuclease I